MKVCPDCKQEKSLDQFAKHSGRKDGLAWRCKACHAVYVAAHKEANPRYYREVQLRNKYGITLEQYDAMLEQQKGLCAICHKSCPTGKALAVDHCHETGEIRGLLCGPCNSGIGLLQHDVDLLTSAIAYLVRSEAEVSETAAAIA